MKRLAVRGSGLRPSCLCLGSAGFGSTMSEKESFALMDAFVDMGGNFIDTAHGYADWIKGCGGRCVSEKTIGRWMKARGNRGSIVIGTKGGWVHHKTHKLLSSKRELLSQIGRSLKELRTDRIDLYWLHRDDPKYPVSHFIDVLNEERERGRIVALGCSNWTAARIREANAYAAANRLAGFTANQMWWGLAAPDLAAYGDPTTVGMDADTMRLHRKTRMLAVPYSPQSKGFFNKLDEKGLKGLDEFHRRVFATPENVARLTRLKKVAAEVGASIAQVALAWVMAHPFPTIPIIGCRTAAQLADTVKATEVSLTEEMVRYLADGTQPRKRARARRTRS